MSIRLYYLTFLQEIPVVSRNIQRLRLLHIKFANAVNHDTVTIADHIVVDTVRLYPKSAEGKHLLLLGDLPTDNLKGKFRSNHPQGIDYSG